MREVDVALRHQAVELVIEVTARGGIRVFLDREARRGMSDHHRAQPVADPGTRDHVLETISELEQPLTRGTNFDLGDHPGYGPQPRWSAAAARSALLTAAFYR